MYAWKRWGCSQGLTPSLTDLFACFFRPEALDAIVPEQEPDLITSLHKCKIRFLPNPVSDN